MTTDRQAEITRLTRQRDALAADNLRLLGELAALQEAAAAVVVKVPYLTSDPADANLPVSVPLGTLRRLHALLRQPVKAVKP